MHKPIVIHSLSLSFPHKTCFHDFSTVVRHGDRIAIIGKNGAGKSSLLRVLAGLDSCEGNIQIPSDVRMGFLPQVITDHSQLSGGERLNRSLTEILAQKPQLLLLDEPTNHLDQHNRKALIRMLDRFSETLIIASHDTELLRILPTIIWHINEGQCHVFRGSFDDYQRERLQERSTLEKQILELNRQKKAAHESLMSEQARAKTSRKKGEKSIEQRKWPTIVSSAKARRAEETSGRLSQAISKKKEQLTEQLATLRLPEVIKPKFYLPSTDNKYGTLVSISNGSIAYDEIILKNIFFTLISMERVAITGKNGSGKTSLLKALLGDSCIKRGGNWLIPKPSEIGYLDQHYQTLDEEKTALELMLGARKDWRPIEARKHLNDFLFRKNEEVNTKVKNLSGGEKARLSLALIAACSPKLLLLDEITNNLDRETKQHVIEVIRDYPGALLIVSHDEEFLSAIGIKNFYSLTS